MILTETSLQNFKLLGDGLHHFLVIFRFFPMMTSSQNFDQNFPKSQRCKKFFRVKNHQI